MEEAPREEVATEVGVDTMGAEVALTEAEETLGVGAALTEEGGTMGEEAISMATVAVAVAAPTGVTTGEMTGGMKDREKSSRNQVQVGNTMLYYMSVN